jgi:hypothetical protein
MYTLTEITTTKGNLNYHQEIVDCFTVVNRETSPIEFENSYNCMYGYPKIEQEIESGKKIFELKDINKDIYCLVVTEGGRKIIPLYKKQYYYVVTENGKTFKNLSFN